MATDNAGRILDVVDRQEEALRVAERTAAQNASAPLRAAIGKIVAAGLVALDRGVSFDIVMRDVSEQLLDLPLNLVDSAALLAAFEDAVDIGIGNARDTEGEGVGDTDRRLPVDIETVAEDAPRSAFARLRQVVRTFTAVRSVAQFAAQMSRVNAAVTSVERAATYGVNAAHALGVTRVAVDSGAHVIWLPERDACLDCLGYAGVHVLAGQPFPAGLTFDRKPRTTRKPPSPPLHPNCRCRLAPYRPEAERPGEVTLPDALQREARRSVALGFSLPSEAETRRVEAAARLLREGAGLPKGVEAYAARAVDRGEFPRGRGVPTGDGSTPSLHRNRKTRRTLRP